MISRSLVASALLLLAAPVGAQENGAPLGLPEVLAHPAPFDLYAAAYGSFRLSSRARLGTGSPEGVDVPEAATDLERDEQGNFRLSRRSLDGGTAVELVYLDRRFHLRAAPGQAFRALRPQEEFFRWAHSAFSEVFALLATAGTREASACPRTGGALVCLDPTHGLPLEAEVPKPVQGLGTLVVRLRVDPVPPGTIRIEAPPSPEKPRK